MRLDLPRLRERFGAVLFYGLQSVYELDAGLESDERETRRDAAIQRVPHEILHQALGEMAIVVPVREEKLKLLEGVLTGIPHACQIIVVSNSSREPVDRFQLEKDMVETFSAYTNRYVMCVHQRDPRFARAFEAAGYTEILDEDGLIRHGKAEGMMLATMLAGMTDRRTVGFIDSDNYFPGAVLEYCHLYAAGFAMAKRKDYAMVRISWSSKPKIVESSLYFAKWGRSSVVTNNYLNQLVSYYTGFETEVIRTGNAGEHAMTLDLAMNMGYSSGYSVEPNHLVYLMEEYGGISEPREPVVMDHFVHIYQVESRNPHLHESKGEEHVDRMIQASLSVVYHSSLCPPTLKKAIEDELIIRGTRAADSPAPERLRQYPPLAKADMDIFREEIQKTSDRLDTPQANPRASANAEVLDL